MVTNGVVLIAWSCARRFGHLLRCLRPWKVWAAAASDGEVEKTRISGAAAANSPRQLVQQVAKKTQET